jgi:hypothetical protein
LEQDGGATYNVHTGRQPKTGYAVSVHKEREKKLALADVQKPGTFLSHVSRYVKDNMDLLKQPGYHLGLWHRPTDHTIFLDVSKVMKTPEEAHRLGQQHGQDSYFDLKHKQSVKIEMAEHQNKVDGGREPLVLMGPDEISLDDIVHLVERMSGGKCTPQGIEAARKELAGEDGGLIPPRGK